MRDRRPDVEVVVALHDGQRYVQDFIRSLAEQTVVPNRVLLFDDASRDQSLSIAIEECRNRALTYRSIRNTNAPLGPAAAFCIAAQQAECETVMLGDQDDIWLPEKIDRAVSVLAHYDVSLYAANVYRWLGGNLEMGRPRLLLDVETVHEFNRAPSQFRALLRRGNICTGMTLAFGHDELKYLKGLPSGAWMHDAWLALQVAAGNQRIFIDPRPAALYRQHDENVVGSRAVPMSTAGLIERMRIVRRKREPLGRLRRLEALLEALSARPVEPGIIEVVHEEIEYCRSRIEHSLGQRWHEMLERASSGSTKEAVLDFAVDLGRHFNQRKVHQNE